MSVSYSTILKVVPLFRGVAAKRVGTCIAFPKANREQYLVVVVLGHFRKKKASLEREARTAWWRRAE